jgi:histone H3/H4
MKLKEQHATAKMAGVLQASTGVMVAMQQAVHAPSIMHTSRQYAMEMQRAGLLQEMAEDVMEDATEMADDAEDVQEEDIQGVLAAILGQQQVNTSAAQSDPEPDTLRVPHEALPPDLQPLPSSPVAGGLSPGAAAEAMPSAPTGAPAIHIPQLTGTGSPVAAGYARTPVASGAGVSPANDSATPPASDLEQRLKHLSQLR